MYDGAGFGLRHFSFLGRNYDRQGVRYRLFATLAAPDRQDNLDLYRAIDGLPDKLRLTVILFYFREMDVNETAQVLKVPAGTVKSRLNKARKLLKEVLTNGTDLQF